jgi:hypothetical protein
MARVMPPRPMMLMLLMVCLLSRAGQDAVPAPVAVNGGVVGTAE